MAVEYSAASRAPFDSELEALKVPPHSIEAEQGVLGCVLLAGNDLLPDFVAKCDPDAFYDLRHRTICECGALARRHRASGAGAS